jgi:hypothetical protein
MTERPIDESYWVIAQRLLASAYPGAQNEQGARARLRKFIAAGVTFFVDLTEADEGLMPYAGLLRDEAEALGRSVVHRRMSIVDGHIPTADHMKAILDLIAGALDEGHTVCVHCWGGVGRTGTVVGCHLVRGGATGDAALHRVQQLFDTTPKHLLFSPETPQQARFVRDWIEPARG